MLSGSVLRAAARPTARASNLGLAAVTIALGAVPAGVALAVGSTSLGVPITVLTLTAGAVLGWGGEDPTGELLVPLPVPSTARTAMRTIFLLTVAVVGVTLAGIAIASGPGLPSDLLDRLPEALAAGGAALGLALVLDRRGDRGSGAAGVAAGLLVPTFLAALAFRWPRVLPALTAGPIHDRWWLVATVLAVVVLRVGRDPARH